MNIALGPRWTMKVNEKNLISYALSSTPVDREGYLLKKGDLHKSFQKRWFVLKGNLLYYFDKRSDREPVGVIILEGCTLEVSEDDAYGFKVVFHGAGNRTYFLCAENQENMEGWMKALACASYDYMKLMVAELQKQLDDITEAERLAKLEAQNPPPTKFPTVNVDDSVPGKRYNPFDKWKHMKEDMEQAKGAVGGHDLEKGASKSSKSSFPDLHLHYGRRFVSYFEEQRQRHLEGYKGGFTEQDLL